MTKRFRLIKNHPVFVDGIYHENHKLSDKEVVDMLNEQSETITDLYSNNEDLRLEVQRLTVYENNTKEVIQTILQIATRNGVIGKTELLKVINND